MCKLCKKESRYYGMELCQMKKQRLRKQIDNTYLESKLIPHSGLPTADTKLVTCYYVNSHVKVNNPTLSNPIPLPVDENDESWPDLQPVTPETKTDRSVSTEAMSDDKSDVDWSMVDIQSSMLVDCDWELEEVGTHQSRNNKTTLVCHKNVKLCFRDALLRPS